MSEWREFPDRARLDAALAEHLAERLRADTAERGRALLALSGGSTPRGMLQCLAACELDWRRVVVTLVDERWVPPEHEDSNERMVRENLLRGPAAAAELVGLKSPPASPSAGLAETEPRIAALPLPFSATVLGMGADGHTASWFPRAANLRDLLDPERSSLVGITDPVTAAHPRITLTLSAVLASREIILHITGAEKRRILETATERGLPVSAVTGQSATPVTVWWAP